MIIEIRSTDDGTWNLTAKADTNPATVPFYMARNRSAWAIRALVRGILADHEDDHTEPEEQA